MAKRLIVDGVEFSQVVQFPRIFSAITSALQPSRLAMALLMVVALVAAGRLWDNLAPATVHSRGLESGRFDPATGDRALQMALHDAMHGFAKDQPAINATEPLEARQVLAEIEEGFRHERMQKSEGRERDLYDRHYATTVRMIEEARPRGAFESSAMHIAASVQQVVAGVLALDATAVLGGVNRVLIGLPTLLWRHQPWFLAVYGLVFVTVMSVGGGAIARMQALQTAAQRRIRLGEAVDFALAGWGRLILAQALPLLLVSLVALVIAGLALLLLVPGLDVLGGLLYGLALLLGFLAAFLLIGFAVGFPLLVPAVACENSDGPDAMQRAFAYVVTRPLHLLFYWVLALIGLALGFVLVSLFATVLLNVTASVFLAVSSNEALLAAGGFSMFDLSPRTSAVAGSWHERWTAELIQFWQTIVVGLVAAYVVSYFFSAFTVVYLLMRLACDGQDIEEVWQPGMIQGTRVPEADTMDEPMQPLPASGNDAGA